MKVALAQVNPTVGDLEGNVALCLEALRRGRDAGADLVVLPAMAVPGEAPRDILNDPGFARATVEATVDLARRAGPGAPALVGTLAPGEPPRAGHPGLLQAAALLQGGEAHTVAAKRLLADGDTAFDSRWYVAGDPAPLLDIAGERVGVLVGEGDLLGGPSREAAAAGAGLLVCLAATPYVRGALEPRLAGASALGLPVALANLWGGSDELLFEGRSFLLGAGGYPRALLRRFGEEVVAADPAGAPVPVPGDLGGEAELFDALAVGVRDFARKNGVRHAILGLSGGVDSAVVAVVAAEALGGHAVTAVAVPSRHTDPRSTDSARELAAALGAGFEVIPLEPLHAAAEAALGELVATGTSAENIQARLRAALLMAVVNRRGGMLLNTSNKTELSLGYSTLYGDSAGALAPLGDLTKPEVVALARWIRESRGLIPDFTLERPPTAELAPRQVDPFDYGEVSPRLEALVRADQSDGALRRSEHKRRQMGPILKVGPRAFGPGRLIPITRR